MRVAILTVSDAGARGERVDTSGDTIAAWVRERGHQLSARSMVADDVPAIVATLQRWADDGIADLVLTTGGTGLGPRDVTPEATRAVVEREAPGIAESIRAAGMISTPLAALSRGIAGTRHRTLIINLPGSTRAVREGLAAMNPFIDHAIRIITVALTEHP